MRSLHFIVRHLAKGHGLSHRKLKHLAPKPHHNSVAQVAHALSDMKIGSTPKKHRRALQFKL